MSLKRKDTDENRAYWDFVEQTAEDVRENMPAWMKGGTSERKPIPTLKPDLNVALARAVTALETTAGNIRSLGPAGALGGVQAPYALWLAEVEQSASDLRAHIQNPKGTP